MPYIGEIAALLTSLAWSFTSSFFTLAGRRVGSVVVNRTRLLLAVVMLCLTNWVISGSLLPLDADPSRWLWLGLSGIVGLVLGDAFLFQAFLWIGPRLSMLMMSLAPVIASLVAWIFLGEKLTLGQIAGILLTIVGIAWVVLERNSSQNGENRDYRRGILFGLGAATGQAVGLVLAKNGLSGEFSPISGNVIRMVTAASVMWGFTIIQGQAGVTLQRLVRNRNAILFILGGAIFGPFLGVSLSLFAIQQTEIGVASTLMALLPVFLLPIGHFIFNEHFGWGAIAGTLLAISGVAILFLV
jgi:drug/metabolite transporter (DMT)-like permease